MWCSRVRTQLEPPGDGGGKDDGGEEVSGELIVASGDAPEVLEASEHALDQVALAIECAVVWYQRLAAMRGSGSGHLLGSSWGTLIGSA